jgi:hypothetical protein
VFSKEQKRADQTTDKPLKLGGKVAKRWLGSKVAAILVPLAMSASS